MAHNISEAEVSRAVQALRVKGIPDDQIAEVIGAMAYCKPPMSTTDGVTLTHKNQMSLVLMRMQGNAIRTSTQHQQWRNAR